MPGPNRGALPLALLIVAALAAGIVIAVMRIDEQGIDIVGPSVSPDPTITSPTVEPTEEPTVEPTEEPTLEPTEEPTLEPTEEPTEEPTVEPTEEPTEEPSPEPTDEPSPEPTDDGNGGNNGNGDGDILAQTGGPLLPYFLGGALMIAGSAALWRLRRVFD